MVPMVEDTSGQLPTPAGLPRWKPKYIGDTYPDLRHSSQGNARWFMCCWVSVAPGGDAAQLDNLAAEPDVVELEPQKKTVTRQKRDAVMVMTSEAGLTLADTGSEQAICASIISAIAAKESGLRGLPAATRKANKETERDAILAKRRGPITSRI